MAARDKYAMFWIAGAFISFLLYYSGITACYIYFRKRAAKRPRSIVITYHRINDDDDDPYISVSTLNFRRQMEYLKRDFEVVSLNTMISGKGPAGKDRVSITFDDGYKDNYLNAYPILKESGLPATIFISTGAIGSEKRLSADEIRKMKDDGIDFGSHTVTHPVLSKISIEQAAAEILDSKKSLEGLLNEKVGYFAYPFGKKAHFNGQITDIIRNAGYKAAFTTENGEVTDTSEPFSLARVGIRNCPLFVFKARISGIFESRPFTFVRQLLGVT